MFSPSPTQYESDHDAINAFTCKGERYGRVQHLRGFEQQGAIELPVAIFQGGARVALYCVPDSEDRKTWRNVFKAVH